MAQLNSQSQDGKETIIFIDGECHLCQNITKYLVKHDHRRTFSFATLQSAAGQRLLREGGLPTDDWDSFVLFESGRFYTNSGAALRVMKGLGGWRGLLYALIIVPAPLRNAVYGWIAKNRHRLSGGAQSCLMPTPEVMSRFVKNGISTP
ncbi:thiol-disulfide oxidoreductase DCC family protein [Paenibacillus paeoniae]|uniref:DUF393 domain-containing protein n=1 Tax=Paenibacillus paeoniae TaxID=2292705 RepID=A0A371PLJ1_9BACL|nr:DCC1-like thiol-disulfide oxidoreductase family protein [Paenibacillus paeoniae]REK77074.1 DUF393 domain-containing protein [Paenibacillus paeoniae]